MRKKFWLSVAACLCILFCSKTAFAAVQEVEIVPDEYIYEEGWHYAIDSAEKLDYDPEGGLGDLFLSGDFVEVKSQNGFRAFDVKDGNLTLRYDQYIIEFEEEGVTYSMEKDSTKEINGFLLETPIKYGALLVQTSLDGIDWVTDKEMTDVLSGPDEATNPLYETKQIQLVNGCYYRVIFAYKVRIEQGSKVLFVPVNTHDAVECADVYQFYAINKTQNENSELSPGTLKKNLGEKCKVKADNGYDTKEKQNINVDDPHYGWNLGTFFVSDYTREVKDENENPVFLKNVGDTVTLWFNLTQDINKLNGNTELTIAEDKKGYDQRYEIQKQNFKHGALIVRFTDREGVKKDPVVYTNFLAASASTGANTKVELFEEGDYEVSLDYKIKNSPRKVIGVEIVPTYTDYTITFKFSVRNGNCMVFPFDLVTGSELADNAVTENGFRLDMAKSKYLDIDVTRKVMKNGVEDVRFNRPAKDGDTYTDEGIYVFKVKNLYTGENTTKTIYVGEGSKQ